MSVSYVLKEIVNSASPSPKSRLSNPVELDEFNLTEGPFNEAQGIRIEWYWTNISLASPIGPLGLKLLWIWDWDCD